MSFSANIPALGNKITKDVPDQNALNQRMMRCDFSDVTDLPVGTKALVESAEGWEVRQFNGTGWVLLEKWNIDAQKVDGHSASTGTTANTIPVRDASGKLPGDITGNAATASKAAALSATNPLATGGTGATTAEQARENLVVPPKSHASSSTEYGAGSTTQYGHLKSHDAPDATKTAATGHAFSPAGAKTELDKKLDKSGDTMTGDLTVPNMRLAQSSAGYGEIVGADSDAANPGPRIRLYKKDDPTYPGYMIIQGRIGSKAAELQLRPNDGAYINNQKVLTSVGGEVGKLSSLVYDALGRNSNSYGLNINGGINGDANNALIRLYGRDHSTTPGRFYAQADNGTARTTIHAEPGGPLQVNNLPVLTSAGGTMAGVLRTSGDCIRNFSDDTWISIKGGSEHNHGAALTLYGQSSEGNGFANLIAYQEGVGGTTFEVIPGRGCAINGKFISTLEASGAGYLRYSDGTQITMQTLTVTSGGGTYTLPMPFKDASYYFMPCVIGYSDAEHNITCQAIDGASFRARANSGTLGCQVVCIGRWK